MPATRPARLTALALLAACCAAFAPAPVYREPKPDRRPDEEKLQGTWKLVSLSVRDFDLPDQGEVVFTGRRLSFFTWGEALGDYTFSLDPTASPKRLDLRNEKGAILRCIYRLEGDRLTLARGLDWESARPGDFRRGRDSWLEVYRRARRGR